MSDIKGFDEAIKKMDEISNLGVLYNILLWIFSFAIVAIIFLAVCVSVFGGIGYWIGLWFSIIIAVSSIFWRLCIFRKL